MADPEEKKRNDAEFDNTLEENDDLIILEDDHSGEFDIREDELELGDDYIASALASLENYPEHSGRGIDYEHVEEDGMTNEKTEEEQYTDMSSVLAPMQERITELEATLKRVQTQAKKKLESQAHVIQEANKLVHKLRDRSADLEKGLAEKAEESEEHKRKWQETVASYLNYQKQSKKKLADFIEIEKGKIIRQFLPVIDDFRRSMSYDTGSESFVEGVKLIYRQMDNFIQNLDVRTIPAIGEPFDPYNHEAVNRVPVDDGPSNIIIEELQTGYFWGDKVLRPSKVSVSYRAKNDQVTPVLDLEDTNNKKVEPATDNESLSEGDPTVQDAPDIESKDTDKEEVAPETEDESLVNGDQNVPDAAEN